MTNSLYPFLTPSPMGYSNSSFAFENPDSDFLRRDGSSNSIRLFRRKYCSTARKVEEHSSRSREVKAGERRGDRVRYPSLWKDVARSCCSCRCRCRCGSWEQVVELSITGWFWTWALGVRDDGSLSPITSKSYDFPRFSRDDRPKLESRFFSKSQLYWKLCRFFSFSPPESVSEVLFSALKKQVIAE